MIRYLCDTNVISEIMKKKPDPAVYAWFSSLQAVAVSTVTVEELQYGLRRKRLFEKEAWFRRFILGPVKILPVTDADALWAGEKRGDFSLNGITITQADAFIAAAAWRHGLILATRNIDDFKSFNIPLYNPFPPAY